jgi:uncharacterized protein with PQ loop repeat
MPVTSRPKFNIVEIFRFTECAVHPHLLESSGVIVLRMVTANQQYSSKIDPTLPTSLTIFFLQQLPHSNSTQQNQTTTLSSIFISNISLTLFLLTLSELQILQNNTGHPRHQADKYSRLRQPQHDYF